MSYQFDTVGQQVGRWVFGVLIIVGLMLFALHARSCACSYYNNPLERCACEAESAATGHGVEMVRLEQCFKKYGTP